MPRQTELLGQFMFKNIKKFMDYLSLDNQEGHRHLHHH